MRFFVGLLLCAGVANFALADNPPAAPAGTPAAAAAASTPSAPSASAPAAAAQPADAAKPAAPTADQVDAQEKHFISEGYTLEMHGGQKMFCRREATLGTRLGANKKYCSTAEQLAQTERDAQRAMDRSTWQQNNPSGK